MSTWHDVLMQFRMYLERSGLAQSTIDGYVHDVEGFSSWLTGCEGREVSPSDFSRDDVEGYTQYLSDTQGRSPASINRCLQSLRKFGHFAVAEGIRDTSPAQEVRLLEGTVPSMPRALTTAEVAQLIEAARARRSRTATRDYAIIQLLLQTGIRASELVHLQRADVDLLEGHGTLTIRGRIGRPERQLPLNETARSALCAYLDQPRPLQACYLFLGRDSQPLSVRSVQQIVADLGKAAGLDISARTLRDTYARCLWQDTGDLNLLVEYLGHKRPETALRYISPSPVGREGR
jgi:integrase/recombinase XerD